MGTNYYSLVAVLLSLHFYGCDICRELKSTTHLSMSEERDVI